VGKKKSKTKNINSHRIGQTKRVTVYKLVAKDTVDWDIYKMQEKKKKMNAAIMESNSSTVVDKKTKKELTEASIHRFIHSVKKESQQDDNVMEMII
jgi:hypothetical protein